ncbi:hypothetical protein PIB30_048838 [Stylosanthes scabra]|uniref:Uncharacterized protein n=1 Tax=Stylosanthes scabra TaxID=79078 RepID=A0ABU6UFV9_9FABA|nr:hypothetical protein [Stylosanthes scabra]
MVNNLSIPPSPLPHNNNNNNSSINMIHKIYACIITSLLAFLQIQTSSSNSPFQVHPLITGASVLSIFGYYLAFVASLRLLRYATQLSMAMAVFRLFSIAWLVTLLIPEWALVRYVFNGILAFLELHQVFMAIYERFIKRRILIIIVRMKRSWWWIIIINSITNSQRHTLLLAQSSHARI